MRSIVPVLAALLSIPTVTACRRSAPEPGAPAPSAPVQPRSADAGPVAPYRPSLEDSARRVLAARGRDSGDVPVATRTVRVDLADVPPQVDVVAVKHGDRWTVGAVERDRVTVGLEGAERVIALLTQARTAPDARAMTRIVGAFYYYPWPVWDGETWSRTAEPTDPGPAVVRPALNPRERAGGRTLLFAYWIPMGQPGAGSHVANLRLTDSGLFLDNAPNPQRR